MGNYDPYHQVHYDRLKDAGIGVPHHTNRLSVEVAKQLHQQNRYQLLSTQQSAPVGNRQKDRLRNPLRFVATAILRLTGNA
jgi:hypothetical protein